MTNKHAVIYVSCVKSRDRIHTKHHAFGARLTLFNSGCTALGWSRSGSVIQDHSDHATSKEPMNPWPEWIHRFLWCTMIWVILDHWSWSRSPQKNAPSIILGSHLWCSSLAFETSVARHGSLKPDQRKYFVCFRDANLWRSKIWRFFCQTPPPTPLSPPKKNLSTPLPHQSNPP